MAGGGRQEGLGCTGLSARDAGKGLAGGHPYRLCLGCRLARPLYPQPPGSPGTSLGPVPRDPSLPDGTLQTGSLQSGLGNAAALSGCSLSVLEWPGGSACPRGQRKGTESACLLSEGAGPRSCARSRAVAAGFGTQHPGALQAQEPAWRENPALHPYLGPGPADLA